MIIIIIIIIIICRFTGLCFILFDTVQGGSDFNITRLRKTAKNLSFKL